eukprot:TRINITY_DN82852_c0_g1_i1.p1 TRINITY_DN82852_c0_g1~~TRINITY_DN82852_c0_g1_i1.p1  ORF type:complete len:402 (-),score=42.99 TRINITY_DN82852_c0_g1_i1:137-1342(-)
MSVSVPADWSPSDATEQEDLSGACASATSSVFKKVARPLATLTVGAALGCVSHLRTLDGRLRAPEEPVAVSGPVPITKGATDETLSLPEMLNRFPEPFPVPEGDVCGAALCHEGDICCPGGPGYGFACGAPEAVCCQGVLYTQDRIHETQFSQAIVCADADTCCRNIHGNPYCCADGSQCSGDVCVAYHKECFPGDATVDVAGQGRTSVSDLRVGDSALVQRSTGEFAYSRIRGFLHHLAEDRSEYLTIVHTSGQLRISGSHLVFVERSHVRSDTTAGHVTSGDKLIAVGDSDEEITVRVMAVLRSPGAKGMYAPLTESGTLVVDGVAASNYATAFAPLDIPHGAMHASFFSSRIVQVIWDLVCVMVKADLSVVAELISWRHDWLLQTFVVSCLLAVLSKH